MKEVESLSDSELVAEIGTLRANEKATLYALLIHLGEIDARKLYRDEGYSSFFSYLEVGLGYSKASAYRRVEAARFLREKPEMYQRLTSGELTFSSLVELSKCKEKRNLEVLVEESVGKSHREVASLVAKETPKESPKKRERVRIVRSPKASPAPLLESKEPSSMSSTEGISAAEPHYEIAFQVDEEFMTLYREAKAVAGGQTIREVFIKLLKDYTTRNSPKERLKRREARKPSPKQANTSSRYISAKVSDEVHVRDQGRCTYISAQGTRCSCTINLHYDHIYPYALGGESTTQNLRLLCPAHNQLMAERVYGKEFMERKRLQ